MGREKYVKGGRAEVIHRGKSSNDRNSIDDQISESVDSNPVIFKTGKPRSIDRLAQP